MKKRFLGIICLLYAGIIIYIWMLDELKNFLAPQMQIYIKLSVVPMLLIGLVMLFNNNIHYKFKISDLVLILPLMMFIFTGDGRLTSTLASNRTINYNIENRTKTEETTEKIDKEEEKQEEIKEEEKEETKESLYDFSNPDFNIVDANYNELSYYISFSPKAQKYEGKTIKVRGFVMKNAPYLKEGYFTIGKYAISCCVADAGYAFFFAQYDGEIIDEHWYEIEGVLEKGKDVEDYDILYINVINMKEIDSKDEEQYVYPCYSYDNGSCMEVTKYNLEY